MVALDNIEFAWYDEFQGYLASHKGTPLTVTVRRDNELVDFTVSPTEAGILGIFREPGSVLELSTKHYSFFRGDPCRYNQGMEYNQGLPEAVQADIYQGHQSVRIAWRFHMQ